MRTSRVGPRPHTRLSIVATRDLAKTRGISLPSCSRKPIGTPAWLPAGGDTVHGAVPRPAARALYDQSVFVSIFLGIENVSAKSLRAMRKPNTVDLIRRGVSKPQSQNITVIAGLINGLPHDDSASIRENYEFVKSLGITSVMDQLLTPYPKTPLRGDMLASNLVANLDDFRWYDGYFSNVRTEHLSPERLSFVRWKTRRDVIGMWRATRADWKYFKGYTYLWEFGLRYVVWLNERLLELLFGVEGRYKIQMRQYLQLNDFGIDVDGLPHRRTYHPIFGTADDPFVDSRSSLIRRKLPFLQVAPEEPTST